MSEAVKYQPLSHILSPRVVLFSDAEILYRPAAQRGEDLLTFGKHYSSCRQGK